MKVFLTSLRMLVAATLLLGVVYPLAVWGVGQLFFRHEAEGSLLVRDGRVVGSSLLSQGMEDQRFFWPRPSACGYNAVPSGASNLPWSSAALLARIDASPYPDERATQSASGLDPDLTPEAVLAQMDRVSVARNWNTVQCNRVAAWIAFHTEGGIISSRYVNVLELNLALEKIEADR